MTNNNPKRIKAVGFDFDETLFQTEDRKAQIIETLLRKTCGSGKGVARDYKGMTGSGIPLREKIRILHERHCGKAPAKYITALEHSFEYYYKVHLRSCPMMQCANIIKEVRDQAKVVFLVSLMPIRDIRPALRHCGIIKYFDNIIGGIPKERAFAQILKTYRLTPMDVLYVGDSKGDARAARKSGIHFVAVNHGQSQQQTLRKLGAHFTFSSLCDLPLALLTKEPEYEQSLEHKLKKLHPKMG